jgi:hypothetical protein
MSNPDDALDKVKHIMGWCSALDHTPCWYAENISAHMDDSDVDKLQEVAVRDLIKAHDQALLDKVEKEIIKVPPCNCKHARQIVAEQRQALARWGVRSEQ